MEELREGGKESGREESLPVIRCEERTGRWEQDVVFILPPSLPPSLPPCRGSPFLPLVTNREDGGGDGPKGESAWSGFYSGYPEVKEAARRADALLR